MSDCVQQANRNVSSVLSEVETYIAEANEIKSRLLDIEQSPSKPQNRQLLTEHPSVDTFFHDIGSRIMHDNGMHGLDQDQIKVLHDLTYAHMISNKSRDDNFTEVLTTVDNLEKRIINFRITLPTLKLANTTEESEERRQLFESQLCEAISEIESYIISAEATKTRLLRMKKSEKIQIQSKVRLNTKSGVTTFLRDICRLIMHDNGLDGLSQAQIKAFHAFTYAHMGPFKVKSFQFNEQLAKTSSKICDLEREINNLQLKLSNLKSKVNDNRLNHTCRPMK